MQQRLLENHVLAEERLGILENQNHQECLDHGFQLACRCLALRWNQWQEERLQISKADCFFGTTTEKQLKNSFEKCFFFFCIGATGWKCMEMRVFLSSSNGVGAHCSAFVGRLQDTFYAAVTNVWRRALESYHLWAPCLKMVASNIFKSF